MDRNDPKDAYFITFEQELAKENSFSFLYSILPQLQKEIGTHGNDFFKAIINIHS